MEKKNRSTANQSQEIQVKVPDNLRAPAYANIVNVSAEESEVTFNFVYVHSQDTPAGTLVARVVVPRRMLSSLRDLLVDIAEVVGGDRK